MERIVVRLLSIIFISLIIVGCNRQEIKESKSISHCSDIKFISYANNNPHLFIDPSKAIAETKKRDIKIKEWIKINHDPKDMMAIGKWLILIHSFIFLSLFFVSAIAFEGSMNKCGLLLA